MSGRSHVRFLGRLSFGIGSYAEGIKNGAFNYFLLFYYNQVLGLSGSLTGAALAIALIADAVTDPVVGSISDRHQSRIGWGRRHPFMYGAAIPFGIVFYLLFVPPEGLSQLALFSWLVVLAVSCRVALSVYSVPHMTLAAELTPDYDERTVLSAFRSFLSITGAVSVVLIGYTVFFPDNGQLDPANYPAFALTAGIAMAFSILVSAAGTHSYIPSLQQPAQEAPAFSLRRVAGEFMDACRVRAFKFLLLALLANAALQGILASIAVYIMTFFFQFEGSQIGLGLSLGMAGGVTGALICSPIAERIGSKRNGLILGFLWFAGFTSFTVNLRILGLAPENGDPLLFPLVAIIGGIGGIGMGFIHVLGTAMIADVTDEHERLHGERQEGIYYSAISFTGKATSGLGAMIAGFAIDLVGLNPNADPLQAPQAAIDGLGLLYGPGVMVFCLIPIALIWRYDIDRERHRQIRDEISAARAGAGT